MKTTRLILIALLSWLPWSGALAIVPDDLGGRIETQVDGKPVTLPLLKTDIDADVQGDVARVTITQTFANPLDRAVHATYLFPLNETAAVNAMTMEVGDERVQAKIQRIEEARATFERAKSEGRSAALLSQHRPNMFTQDIANLMPGLPIKVTLTYAQTVPRLDGAYELVIPLVVGPRYQPQGAGVAPGQPAPKGGVQHWNAQTGTSGGATAKNSQTAYGQWEVEQLPAYPPVFELNVPDQIDPERVGLTVHLNAGMAIANIESRTHPITTETPDQDHAEVKLANGRTLDNRDFVLRYTLAGTRTQAGLLAYRDQRGGFFSLLLEPPQAPAATDITPREMVFVLDCSGSMDGLPIDASKAFMRAALRRLRPTDSFRIIRFSDSANEFSAQPLPATPQNIQAGLRYTDSLRGEGGTEMSSGIRQALAPPVPTGAIRIVTFLTDGYIGNEAEILALLKANLNDARLYAFGVGTGVNRYLLSEMGRVGRGFTRYMDPTEDQEKVAGELADRLQSPVLTDIEIDWGGLEVSELSPNRLPDLFAGQSLRIQGRYGRPGKYEIKVRGLVQGRPATLPLQIELPETSTEGEAVPIIWARSLIGDLHYQMTTGAHQPGNEPVNTDALKQRITDLGLNFALVTPWTAFVAVSEKIYNANPESTPTLPVPVAQVKGTTERAYGEPATPITTATVFTGGGTPEPAALLGLALVGLLLVGFLLRGQTMGPTLHHSRGRLC
ncbi:MAG TPA: VIT domain-containing protein [Candidatus Competibacter sp.]|nr:VWA domain-containing protein [Candidatus Competibacter sp.]HRX61925.1 VIT domain-containing protein [Candidatus Competibacter sp.]